MSVITVKSLFDQLSSYLPSDQKMLPTLNLVLPRIYAMGYWRDLIYEVEIETENGYVTIPSEAESVMSGMVNGNSKELWGRWHDYRASGFNGTYSADYAFGIVDDGLSVTHDALDKSVEHSISVKPTGVNTTLPNDGSEIVLEYTVSDGTKKQYVFVLTGQALINLADTDVVSVSLIRYSGVSQRVKLEASDGDKTYLLSEGRGDFVSRYRRYRLSMPSGSATQAVQLLLKRSFEPLMDEYDLVHLGNLNAIKHGILATTAEDNADIERASYHWQVCKQLLEEELDAFRGGARSAMRVDPSGGHRIYGMY